MYLQMYIVEYIEHSLFKTLESYADLDDLQVGNIHLLSSSCKVSS